MSRPYKKRMVEDDDDSDDDVAPAKASRAASSGKRRKVDDEDDEEEVSRRPMHDHHRAGANAPPHAQEGQVSDDDEEGELPEERGRPQPSAPPEPPEDYNSADEYDANLFKGPEDRRQVEAMTEIEREMLMAERYEKHMRRKEVLEIREKAREKREGRKPAGRSRDTKKRLETTNDKSSKMREIAALRKDKEKRKQEESERNQARRKGSRDDDDDDDDDEEDEARREEGEAQRREEHRRREEVRRPPSPRAGPADLERVRLTRQKLEQWLAEPFFDGVVAGCFVRVNVGEKAGMPVYRVAEVKSVHLLPHASTNPRHLPPSPTISQVKSVKDGFRKYKLGQVMTGKRLELQARLLPPLPPLRRSTCTPSTRPLPHPLPHLPYPPHPPHPPHPPPFRSATFPPCHDRSAPRSRPSR